jgi:hypothetical protein
MSNTRASLSQFNRESGGRRTGVGQSAVAMGTIVGGSIPWRAASAKTAVARPCQVVAPPPAA